ncbi:DnaD domain protein [Jeotgalicoccus marinus]|uniref:DnaD domain protein n=1 Tax=Jeotgalicoccus marinus TaxID=516700 RepID=UPI001B7F7F69|nr:DnaD domain protein [Jeotgalicoccus marinus]
MFSKRITETDTFLDMPMSTQCLYFHLNMSADDDGFIGNVKTIKRMVGANDDDLKILLSKEFLIPFESGVVVIKDWKIHNYIRSDRYNETVYQEEKQQLKQLKNGSYEVGMTHGIPVVHQRDTQDRLGKDRLGKDRLGKDRLGKDRLEEEQQKPSSAATLLENYFGSITQFMMEDIEYYKNYFDDFESVLELSIDISRQRGVKNWKYNKSILNDWKGHNLKTVEDIKHHENRSKVNKYKNQVTHELPPEQEEQYKNLGF